MQTDFILWQNTKELYVHLAMMKQIFVDATSARKYNALDVILFVDFVVKDFVVDAYTRKIQSKYHVAKSQRKIQSRTKEDQCHS